MISENFYFPWFTNQTIGFVINNGKYDGVGVYIPINKILTDQKNNEALFDFIVWRNLFNFPLDQLQTDEFRGVMAEVINDMMEKIAKAAIDNEAVNAKSYEPQQTQEHAQELLMNLLEEINSTSGVSPTVSAA